MFMGVGEYREYSVLMSVYHKEKAEYLKQAIESIQAQTFPTNDFILVCDGPLNDALDEMLTQSGRRWGTFCMLSALQRIAALEML